MKACVHTRYGPPEVVTLMDVPKPQPKSHEVLVRVAASTVNRTDAGFRSANYFVSRFWSGLFRPKHQVLGCEFAGTIEAIGDDVTTLKIGDRVFGYNDVSFGGHAEYVTIDARKAVETLPDGLSFAEAAPLTEGAHYALNYIRAAKITAGHNVLVYGATGAIGSAAVQLLKQCGARVTAVCNTKNVELLKSLGSDEVVDYQTQDFTATQQKYDMVFDAVGKSSFKTCKPLLIAKGIYVSTELGKNAENIALALFTPLFGGRKVLFPIPTIDKSDLVFLKTLVEEGAYKPVIDRTYALDQIVEAYRYVETGQKTGNVVLKIAEAERG